MARISALYVGISIGLASQRWAAANADELGRTLWVIATEIFIWLPALTCALNAEVDVDLSMWITTAVNAGLFLFISNELKGVPTPSGGDSTVVEESNTWYEELEKDSLLAKTKGIDTPNMSNLRQGR